MGDTSKILIIDGKRNTVEVEVNQNMLKLIGVKPEEVKKHKSQRQLFIEISKYFDSLEKDIEKL